MKATRRPDNGTWLNSGAVRKRRVPVVVFCVDIGTAIDQERGEIQETDASGLVEGRAAVLAVAVHMVCRERGRASPDRSNFTATRPPNQVRFTGRRLVLRETYGPTTKTLSGRINIEPQRHPVFANLAPSPR